MADRMSILVIDDDPAVRDLLEQRLGAREGFEVLLAADGPSGLETAVAQVPNLILLDWRLPGMDGLAVLSRLKERKETAAIPVYMLAAAEDAAVEARARALGAEGLFPKPIDMAALSAGVKRVLAA